jgi:hypothetical protein
VLLLAGAFSLFEASAGWCVIRALRVLAPLTAPSNSRC